MASSPIPIGSDRLYHPASEADVVALVKYARKKKLQVRARGSTHSVAWSIYTDPVHHHPRNRTLEQAPPESDDINLAFDKMRDLEWVDLKNGIVEAGPGINLGCDPEDPFGVSTPTNGFLYQIFEKGWAVNQIGGITHQTLAGFISTGSAGGSTQFAWDNVIAFRIVDGTGKAEWIDKDHPHFDAVSTSMGLLGIITRIRLQLVPTFNIEGTERTTPVSGNTAPMDFFGPGSKCQPSLETYLKETPYTRIVWCPQKGTERIQTWEAKRVPASNDNLNPYVQFPDDFVGQTTQFLGAIFFVLLGNTDPLRIIRLIWQKVAIYLDSLAVVLVKSGSGGMARFFTYLLGCVVGIIAGVLGMVLAFLSGLVRLAFPKLLPMFAPMTKAGQETRFNDWYWRSLCMDNSVNDGLLGTEFTEIWVPIGETQRVINLYREMFESGGYKATGYFSTEVYAGPPSPSWMHPGYTDGSDAYKDGAVRIDVYWYRDNKGVPNADEGFLEQYWELLRKHDIPFRLHWGKFVPRYDFPDWAKHYAKNLPRFADFLAVRKERDPDDVFFTDYWRERLTGKLKKKA